MLSADLKGDIRCQALIREGPELVHSLTNLLTGFDFVSRTVPVET